MKLNMSSTDRIVRLVIAVVALILSFVVGIASVGGIILLLVAVIMAVTGFVRFCPIYRIFRISTNKSQ